VSRGGREADYVPVTSDGHLNGKKSLKPIFKKVLARHREVAGDVPVLVFVDWPGGTINAYYALPTSEKKKDLWGIYIPEAYALGMRYAFHLKTCVSSDPAATVRPGAGMGRSNVRDEVCAPAKVRTESTPSTNSRTPR
jgi:hypothetical protein